MTTLTGHTSVWAVLLGVEFQLFCLSVSVFKILSGPV